MRPAKSFIEGMASMAKNYFNVSEAASEQMTHLEQENAELKEREVRLNSGNSEFT